MKILHTGDWHIGKRVHGISMLEDQCHILEQIENIITQHKIDLVIIAGDVYDRSIPPIEAVTLLNDTLTRMILKFGIKVIIVSGNHDGPERLDFGSQLLSDLGLYIVSQFSNQYAPIELEDAFGKIYFHHLPYTEPNALKVICEDETIHSHEEAMRKMIDIVSEKWKKAERNICIAHAFVAGNTPVETSDSERILSTVGGAENVSVSHFEDFDYVALGHIHRPQKIQFNHIRYSGSILKYSFSEAAHEKSVTIITLKEKGNIDIQNHPLIPIRDMRRLEGTLETLISDAVVSENKIDDYYEMTLTDTGALYEPMQKLKQFYPNTMLMLRKSLENISETREINVENIKQKSPETLFEDFHLMLNGEKPQESINKRFKKYFDEVLKLEGQGEES